LTVSGHVIIQGPDFQAALTLLAALKLPVTDLTPAHCEHFFYQGPAYLPDGMVGLEVFGEVALLRSLAVAPESQRLGTGSALLAHAEAWAQARGVRWIYLLTTTAEAFFARRGYQSVPRDAAPEPIRTTREFSGICPASSIFMVKQLP
jgi:amino-acid N-acetyltransferase